MSMTAREEIQERMALYARALDAKNYEGIADCFAADVRVEYSGFSQVMNCRDEVMAHMRKALEPLAVTQHLFTNFIIELDGDTAKLECDILAQHLKGSGDASEHFLSGGQYRVNLSRASGQWQFTSVFARSTWSMGNREMLPRSG